MLETCQIQSLLFWAASCTNSAQYHCGPALWRLRSMPSPEHRANFCGCLQFFDNPVGIHGPTGKCNGPRQWQAGKRLKKKFCHNFYFYGFNEHFWMLSMNWGVCWYISGVMYKIRSLFISMDFRTDSRENSLSPPR